VRTSLDRMNQPEHTAALELKRQMDEAIAAAEIELAEARRVLQMIAEDRDVFGRVSTEP
jgi:hypothetical protein